MVAETTKTVAGVHLDSNGDRVIGGSQRNDGSVRRVVKVRPGFTPKEDVKRFSVRESRLGEDSKYRSTQAGAFGGLGSIIRANARDNDEIMMSSSKGDDAVALANALGGLAIEIKGKPDKELRQDDDSASSSPSVGASAEQKKATKIVDGHKASTTDSGHLRADTNDLRISQDNAKIKRKPPRRKKYTLGDLDNS